MRHVRSVQTTVATPRCICPWLCTAYVGSRRLDGVHSPSALNETNGPRCRSPLILPSILPTPCMRSGSNQHLGCQKYHQKGPKHYPKCSTRLYMRYLSTMSPRLDFVLSNWRPVLNDPFLHAWASEVEQNGGEPPTVGALQRTERCPRHDGHQLRV
jgi:hypothetical protein